MNPITAIIFLAALLHQSHGTLTLKNREEILEKTNEIRRSVVPTARNMLKMVWSEKAARNAQIWANKCEMRVSPEDERVTDGVTCGENILLSSNPKTWDEAIETWYSQSSNYRYGYGATVKNAHVQSYTQLIWYDSYKIGCAVAYCPLNEFKYFYVCQYCPAGNNVMQIATPYKSGPKCADCPGHCDRGLCTNACKYQDHVGNCKNLKALFGCHHEPVRKKCPATCKCTTQII